MSWRTKHLPPLRVNLRRNGNSSRKFAKTLIMASSFLCLFVLLVAHGGGGNTGKWRGSKGAFYEGGTRVPAVISYPAQLPQGIARDQAITMADWLPTVAEPCGVTLPKVKLDGQSLMPIIRSADTPTHLWPAAAARRNPTRRASGAASGLP
jgi:arylsulfatase A-like enzyme